MRDGWKRQLGFVVCLLAAAALAASVAVAAPKPPTKDRLVKPQTGAVTSAIPTRTPVPSGTLPLPDLNLSEVRLQMLERKGDMPGGMPCWSFSLQAVFMNTGVVATGPFKIVWERADVEAGPYVVPCTACTLVIPDAKPGVGMLPEPRLFNNCSGQKWYRVRLDPDNAVLELLETNNSKLIHF